MGGVTRSSDDGDDRTTSRPVSLDDEEALDTFVEGHDPALVEFYTNGCGTCASMEPVLWNVARATDARVGLLNPRDDPPLIERFEITSVPTLVVFRGGEEVGRLESGFVPTGEVVAFVESRGYPG